MTAYFYVPKLLTRRQVIHDSMVYKKAEELCQKAYVLDVRVNPKESSSDTAKERMRVKFIRFKDLCKAGQDLIAKERPRRAPAFELKLGGSIGREQVSFYRQDAAGEITADADTKTNWSAGASTYLTISTPLFPSKQLYVEGLGTYAQVAKAATQQIEFCSDVGTSNGNPVRECKKGILGAPSSTSEVALAAGFGIADTHADKWRIGILGSFTDPVGSGSSGRSVKYSLGVPFFRKFSKVDGSQLKYEGIFRITPALVTAEDPTRGRTWEVTLQLAVLGQRNIFSNAFNQL